MIGLGSPASRKLLMTFIVSGQDRKFVLITTTRTHQVEFIFCPRQFISEKRADLLCSNSCDQVSRV